MPAVATSRLDRLLLPLHRWVWRDAARRGRKLLRFAETEADGGRDLARAAERALDPLLRQLLLRHADDERRHAALFAARARRLLREAGPRAGRGGGLEANWLAPGERGLDDLRVDESDAGPLLAFLHLSEKAAAGRFALYRELLAHDPDTQAVFADVLRDEEFHMTYTARQLVRLSPRRHGWALWRARAARLWSAYLRAAAALASVMGGVILTVQYFVLLPPFALLAKRAARRERPGWHARGDGAGRALGSQS
jgi:rubrerythrin